MNVEERVREALQQSGRDRHVDVPALHEATKAAILARRDKPVRTVKRQWWPMVIAATAAAGVIGAVAALPGIDLNDSGPGPSEASPHQVENTFACPVQRETRYGPANQDDSFLPELTSDLKPAGEAAGAPRWEAEREDSGAVLRLGNADGTLASVVRFEETSKGYRAVLTTKCSNEGSAAGMVVRGLPPADRNAFTAKDLAPGSVRVLDRMTYDVRGLAQRHTMWAEPCGRSVCLYAGVTNAYTSSRLPVDPVAPVDRSTQLADPDDVVGQDLGVRLVAVYDRGDTLSTVSWDSYDGAISWVEPVSGGGWQGQLFLFVAPDDDLAVVTLHPREGDGRNYGRDDFIE